MSLVVEQFIQGFLSIETSSLDVQEKIDVAKEGIEKIQISSQQINHACQDAKSNAIEQSTALEQINVSNQWLVDKLSNEDKKHRKERQMEEKSKNQLFCFSN